jgi:hypothetical protein
MERICARGIVMIASRIGLGAGGTFMSTTATVQRGVFDEDKPRAPDLIASLHPGLVATADDDPGGIAIYSLA